MATLDPHKIRGSQSEAQQAAQRHLYRDAQAIFKDCDSFDSILARAVGAGSVAWDSVPHGKFDVERATLIVQAALAKVTEIIADAVDEAYQSQIEATEGKE